MRIAVIFGIFLASFSAAAQVDPEEIVKRSVVANEGDWKQAPYYSFVERDLVSNKNGPKSAKTYDVMMIDGSPYNKLTAVNDRPLSAAERQREEAKFQAEVRKRKSESPQERAQRVAKYDRERNQDHALMKEMAVAFQFALAGSDTLDGHEVYVLEATPKPGYRPKSRQTKVLTGMKGKLWIDKERYQWVKVEAQVFRPISFYGFIAKVGPGTRFMLEQAPVAGSLWLPTHFSMIVNASAFGFINKDSTDDETYKDYKRMPDVAPAASR